MTERPAENPLEPQRRAETIEVLIGLLLRFGVATSLVLLAGGSLLSFVQPGEYTGMSLSQLTGAEGSFPRSVHWLGRGLVELRGQAIIVLGLLMLIATPVMRVAVSIVVFAAQRDRLYAVITAVVLMLLVLSFVLGHSAG